MGSCSSAGVLVRALKEEQYSKATTLAKYFKVNLSSICIAKSRAAVLVFCLGLMYFTVQNRWGKKVFKKLSFSSSTRPCKKEQNKIMAEPEEMKYILVSGGVISGVGKGVITSSLGTLLKSVGLRVTAIKIDPYLNIDAGTFSPYEHGEGDIIQQLSLLV